MQRLQIHSLENAHITRYQARIFGDQNFAILKTLLIDRLLTFIRIVGSHHNTTTMKHYVAVCILRAKLRVVLCKCTRIVLLTPT